MPEGYRLYLAIVMIGIAFNVPTGFQFTDLNLPAKQFRNWIQRNASGNQTGMDVTKVWSLLISSRTLGCLLGVALSALSNEILGRRNTLWLTTLPLLLGELLAFTSIATKQLWLFFLGRIMSGFADGLIKTTIAIFFSEISPPSLRGRFGVFLIVCSEIGMLIGLAVTNEGALGHPARLGFIFVLSALMIAPTPLWLMRFPQSPRHLFITKGDKTGAAESFNFYRTTESDWELTKAEFKASVEKFSTRVSLLDVFKKQEFRKPLLLSICLGAMTAFAGRLILVNYSTDLFVYAGSKRHEAEIWATVSQWLVFPALFVNMSCIDYFGRRPILKTAISVTGVVQLIVAVCYCLRYYGFSGLFWKVVPALCISIWIPTAVGGLTALSFIPTEIFSQESRSAGYAAFTLVHFSTATITTALVPVLEKCHPGLGIVFLLVPFICTAQYIWRNLPETKNRTIEDISDDFRPICPSVDDVKCVEGDTK